VTGVGSKRRTLTILTLVSIPMKNKSVPYRRRQDNEDDEDDDDGTTIREKVGFADGPTRRRILWDQDERPEPSDRQHPYDASEPELCEKSHSPPNESREALLVHVLSPSHTTTSTMP
jgi:hypothetical protein